MVSIYYNALESAYNYNCILDQDDITLESFGNGFLTNMKKVWDKVIEAIKKFIRMIRSWFSSKLHKALIYKKGIDMVKEQINSVNKKIDKIEKDTKNKDINDEIFEEYTHILINDFIDTDKIDKIKLPKDKKYSDFIPLSKKDEYLVNGFVEKVSDIANKYDEIFSKSYINNEVDKPYYRFTLSFSVILTESVDTIWSLFCRMIWERTSGGDEVNHDVDPVEVDFDIFEEPNRF